MKADNRIIGGYYSDLCSTAGLFVFVYFLNYITYLNLVQINQKDAEPTRQRDWKIHF